MKEYKMNDKTSQLLLSLDICKLLDSKGKTYLTEKVTMQVFEPGEMIVEKGEVSEDFYIIYKGSAKVWIEEDGEEKILNELHEEDIFGELAAITGKPRSAFITSITPLAVYVIKKDYIKNLLKINPPFKTFLSEIGLHREEENLFK